eukprot:jgi/Mesvir1/24325/Mv11008-RA.2
MGGDLTDGVSKGWARRSFQRDNADGEPINLHDLETANEPPRVSFDMFLEGHPVRVSATSCWLLWAARDPGQKADPGAAPAGHNFQHLQPLTDEPCHAGANIPMSEILKVEKLKGTIVRPTPKPGSILRWCSGVCPPVDCGRSDPIEVRGG